MTETIRKKAAKIKLIIIDVDGVLTDGRLFYGKHGEELLSFNIKDGLGIKNALQGGLKVILVTGRSSEALRRRAQELGVEEVYENISHKLEMLHMLLKKFNLKSSQVCYLGDDLGDLQALKEAGLAVAVRDAAPEVKVRVDYVTKAKGGEGAARELIDLILRAQGIYRRIFNAYL